jgi:hypothetical protein
MFSCAKTEFSLHRRNVAQGQPWGSDHKAERFVAQAPHPPGRLLAERVEDGALVGWRTAARRTAAGPAGPMSSWCVAQLPPARLIKSINVYIIPIVADAHAMRDDTCVALGHRVDRMGDGRNVPSTAIMTIAVE